MTATAMPREIIQRKVVEAVCTVFGVEASAIKDTTNFWNDLKGRPVDGAHLTDALAESFGLHFGEFELDECRSLTDLVDLVQGMLNRPRY